jgi:hypothetical protein
MPVAPLHAVQIGDLTLRCCVLRGLVCAYAVHYAGEAQCIAGRSAGFTACVCRRPRDFVSQKRIVGVWNLRVIGRYQILTLAGVPILCSVRVRRVYERAFNRGHPGYQYIG